VTLAVRPATRDDHPLFVRFHALFESADPAPDLAWWERFRKNAIFMEEDDAPVGYALTSRLGDGGIVMHLAVVASARRRGVGRALMREIATRLRAQGCTRWWLTVKEGNAAAIALYASMGMRIDFRVVSIGVPWRCVERLDTTVLVVESFERREDEGVEEALSLERGRVGRQRELQHVMVRARVGDAIVGVIALALDLRKAFLFRARSPSIARALFEHLHARGDLGDDVFQVVVEDDEPLARALELAGARRVEPMLRMTGPLPP
jgi:GNAT superfamily N-acetyltransferase